MLLVSINHWGVPSDPWLNLKSGPKIGVHYRGNDMEALLVPQKTICLPFAGEEHYKLCMKDSAAFRQFVNETHIQHPELFPPQMAKGFTLHDFTAPSSKQEGFRMRRIKLRDGGKVYQIRPSFMMPHMTAKTDEVEKALFLCRWGVPFWALTYVFGHNDMFWYRSYVSLGRNSIVGTTVKDPNRLPVHLLADEKHTRFNGDKAYVTTTVARECILGVGLADNAGTDALTKGYAHFKEEVQNLKPDYQPETVNTDGWEATRKAWKTLFASVTLILCFLHAFLKIRDCCKRNKELLKTISDKVWNIYHAQSIGEFSQRIRRFRQWVGNIDNDSVRGKVLGLCDKAPEFKKTFSHPQAYRTSNALDRLMNYQDRILYSIQYFHGYRTSALLYLRSMALVWNFHPYSTRGRHDGLGASPFEELNGFQYHSNWLQNMLVAASLGGWKT